MKLLLLEEKGVVSLNYMWLPTWIGMNAAFKRKLEAEFGPRVVGATSDQLEHLEEEVLDYIETQFPGISGLRDYLDGLKFVQG